ncbi:hypothetical protein ACHQM5_002851 [Ranunculus cassubicifolius]
MGAIISLSSSLLILIFTFSTAPLLCFSSASLETTNLATNLKASAAADDGSSGVQKLWCVAKNNADDAALQNAIDWACGHGGTDCGPINQMNGPCYDPTNIQSTASYVFNDYYTRNGRSEEACDFGGTANLFSMDPSHGSCVIPHSNVAVANGGFVGTGSVQNDASDGSESMVRCSQVSIAIFLFFMALPALLF